MFIFFLNWILISGFFLTWFLSVYDSDMILKRKHNEEFLLIDSSHFDFWLFMILIYDFKKEENFYWWIFIPIWLKKKNFSWWILIPIWFKRKYIEIVIYLRSKKILGYVYIFFKVKIQKEDKLSIKMTNFLNFIAMEIIIKKWLCSCVIKKKLLI